MGLVVKDDGWRIPDEMWVQMEPLLPPRKKHPLGCHNPRVPDRNAMDAILFVLRTGSQWNALNATGICSCSSAYRRFREWVDAGVFREFWCLGLFMYDELEGLDWSWVSMDGAITKAPLGGEKGGPKPDGSGKGRHQAQSAHRGEGYPDWPRRRRRKPKRLQDGTRDSREHTHRAATTDAAA